MVVKKCAQECILFSVGWKFFSFRGGVSLIFVWCGGGGGGGGGVRYLFIFVGRTVTRVEKYNALWNHPDIDM